ncbi:MAG TPA: hypothetical protein VNH44_13850 [Micropepsaceae bacterium]|nr:hypothetical protein [Micropepsaceae bacterium]
MTQQTLQTALAVESAQQRLPMFDSTAACEAPDTLLLERFDTQFKALPANTAERVQLAQRIRHQVYCIENPYDKSDNPEGLEIDEFNSHTVQSLPGFRCGAGNVSHDLAADRRFGKQLRREWCDLSLKPLQRSSCWFF